MNIKFIGEYYSDKVLHQNLPDGTRRWRRISGFMVQEVVLGSISADDIEIDLSGRVHGEMITLKEGNKYLVLLELDVTRVEKVAGLATPFQVTNEEILSITEINN